MCDGRRDNLRKEQYTYCTSKDPRWPRAGRSNKIRAIVCWHMAAHVRGWHGWEQPHASVHGYYTNGTARGRCSVTRRVANPSAPSPLSHTRWLHFLLVDVARECCSRTRDASLSLSSALPTMARAAFFRRNSSVNLHFSFPRCKGQSRPRRSHRHRLCSSSCGWNPVHVSNVLALSSTRCRAASAELSSAFSHRRGRAVVVLVSSCQCRRAAPSLGGSCWQLVSRATSLDGRACSRRAELLIGDVIGRTGFATTASKQ